MIMRTWIFSLLVILSLGAWARDEAEEALILNQELQFLENSELPPTVQSVSTSAAAPTVDINTDESLEKTYFGDSERDSVRTRTAAPKRRGL
jgi:hypothetical protein